MLTFTTKDREEFASGDWDELVGFLNDANPLIEQARKDHAIEESAPVIDDDTFDPDGWIGRYPGGVVVEPRPNKMSPVEYEQVIDDLGDWTDFPGVPGITTLFPYLPSTQRDLEELHRQYSQLLIELTESISDQRLDVRTTSKTTTNLEPRGRIDFHRTIDHQAKGGDEVVSRRVTFQSDTLPNYLLVRFHHELARELQQIGAATDRYFVPDVGGQLAYHRQFLQSGVPAQLRDESLEIDFADPSLLERTRRTAPPEFEEVVDHWEAYRHRKRLTLAVRTQLEPAVKPVSKLYEMWVLRQIVDVLDECLADPPRYGPDFPHQIPFGDVVLHYNRKVPAYSHYLTEFGSRGGRPDYVLTDGDRVIWIGDAKFRPLNGVTASDYLTMLGYLEDLVGAGDPITGTFLYVRGEEPEPVRKRHEINHLRLRPSNQSSGVEAVRSLLSDILRQRR